MAESRTFILIFLGPLGFYVHRCISPHVSFEFNLRKGQKSDKLSEAISERDGNSFIFRGSSFFFGSSTFQKPMSTKTMSHLSFPEMPRVLRSTRRSYFVCRCDKHRFRILKRGGRSSRRAQTEEERVAGAKRSETAEKFPVTVHHRGPTSSKNKGRPPAL